jgi:uncharacterized protein
MTHRLPFAPTADGVLVTVKLTPRARRTGIDGIVETTGPRGPEAVLVVRVAAPPVEGAANAALIQLLAKSWRLPPSAFEIASGGTSRIKRVLVRGTPATLLQHINERTLAQ